MAFIAGKGFAILNSKAEQGDQKAKDLLAKLDSIDQEEADRLFSEILGKGGGGGSSKDKKVKAPGASATDGQGKITEGDGEQPPTGKTTPKKAGEAPVAAPAEPTGEVTPKSKRQLREMVDGVTQQLSKIGSSGNKINDAGLQKLADKYDTTVDNIMDIAFQNDIDIESIYKETRQPKSKPAATSPAQTPLSENTLFQAKVKLGDELTKGDIEAWSYISGLSNDEVRETYDKLKGTPAQSKTTKPADPLSNENLQALFDSGLDTDGVIDQVRTQMRDVQLDPNDPYKNSDLQGIVEGFETGYKPGGTNAPEGLVTDLDIERLGEELGISNQEARREYEKAGAQFDTANSVYQPDAKTLLETLSPEQPRLRTAEDARTQELLEFEPEQPAEVGTSFDNALKRTGGNLSGDDARKLAEDYGISVNEVYDIADEYKAEQSYGQEQINRVDELGYNTAGAFDVLTAGDPALGIEYARSAYGLNDEQIKQTLQQGGATPEQISSIEKALGGKPEKFSSTIPTFQEDPKPLYNDPEEAVRETLLFEGGSLSDGDKQGIADEFGISIDEVNQLIRKEQSTTPFRMEEPTPIQNDETQRQVAALDTEIERIRNTQYRNPDDAKNFVDDITNYESDGRPLTESEFNYYASQNNLSKDEAEKAYQEYGDKVYDNIPYSWEEEEERPGEDEKDRRDGAIKDIRDAFNKFGPSRGLSREQIINIATGNSLSEQDVEKLVDEQFAASQAQPTRTVTGQQQVQGQGVKVPPTKETAAAPDRKKLEKAAEDLGVDPNLLEGLLELLKKVR